MYFYIAAAPHCQAPFISPAPLPLSTPLAPLSRRHAYLLTYPHKHAYDDDDDDAIPQFMYVLRLTPLLAGAALVGRAGHAAGKDMRINRRVAAAAVAALTRVILLVS